jgi:hypothetical protein
MGRNFLFDNMVWNGTTLGSVKLGSDLLGLSDHSFLKFFVCVSGTVVKVFVTVGNTGKAIAVVRNIDSIDGV